ELLRLVAADGDVDTAVAAAGDALLEAARELGAPESLFVDAAQAIAPGSDAPARGTAPLAIELVRCLHGLGAPVPAALRALGAIGRKLYVGTPYERSEALRTLVVELAAFGDWRAAGVYARSLPAEKQLRAPEQARGLAARLAAPRRAGADLYRAAAEVPDEAAQ